MSGRNRRPRRGGESGGETPRDIPVVGVGASAGGLEAFSRLLRALPADTGMAFVLVQHLAPSRASALAEILSRATPMKVEEAVDDLAVEPDHVYVIPPGRDMVLQQGHLRLLEQVPRRRSHPIDRFLVSLAEDKGHRAIGVILSGTATDGTLGLEALKASGGITFAQDASAQQGGMPDSAVASGCVDFVLTPEAIAAEIGRIARHPYVAPPQESRGLEAPRSATSAPPDLAQVLRRLQSVTGVDFTNYKTSTLARRIGRRILLRKATGLEDYERILGEDSAEVQALYRDVLIGVTTFFRDPEVFETLRETVIPRMLQERPGKDPLRAWVLGCSTGEEAYSLAMVLTEAAEASNSPSQATIFATDLNGAIVDSARQGTYPETHLHEVGPERLRRFFVEAPGGFRIVRPIRDMCIFAHHNVLADPPFSRMDLVSCRNLLIYLEPVLQQKVLQILHYALKPGGILVLGASEMVGRIGHLFEIEDARNKIFRRRPGPGRVPVLAGPRSVLGLAEPPQERGGPLPSPGPQSRPISGPAPTGRVDIQSESDRLLLSFAPPAVLVDEGVQILEFRGDTSPFLAPAQGKASLSLLKMARRDLVEPLRALLHRARKTMAPARERGIRVRSGEEQAIVDLEVLPLSVQAPGEPSFLVVFRLVATPPVESDRVAHGEGPEQDSRDHAEGLLTRLEQELESTREHLQSLSEQYDSAIEELQSTNEEAQSANEELQSINEELETSKEEIQSSNEELSTVNDELNSRIHELNRLNGDLKNLVSSLHLAVLIVGRDLKIRLVSPVAEALLGVGPTELGRTLAEVSWKFVLPDLGALVSASIESVSVLEREVQSPEGRWYSLRLRPYVTVDSKIDGAVITLIDIDAIRQAREFARNIVETVRDPMVVLDDGLRIRSASRAFFQVFGLAPAATEGRLLFEVCDGSGQVPDLRSRLQVVLRSGAAFDDLPLEFDCPAIGHRTMLLHARRMLEPGVDRPCVLLTMVDVTERRRLEQDLARRVQELAAVDQAKNQFIAVLSHEMRAPLNTTRNWLQILRRPDLPAEKLHRGLEVIERNVSAQTRLIDDLLDVHRMAAGKVTLELAPLSLATLLDSAVEDVLPSAAEKGIALERDLEATNAAVSGDASRLMQVFGNLLGNAVKFTPKGGEIQVALRVTGSVAEVSVTDTGAGINPEAIPHLFELYRQADPFASRSHGGLGLGLAIARQLVLMHGGTISAHSAGRGHGATFLVSLPLAPSGGSPPRTLAEGREPSQPVSLGGLLVLVVDDEPEARESLRRVLEAAGAETVAVGSVDEALETIPRRRPDVIVSDLGMPERDGCDLVRTLRDLPDDCCGQIPAVALSGFSAPEDRERALQAGFQLHMAKPAKPEALIATVADLGRRRRDLLTPS